MTSGSALAGSGDWSLRLLLCEFSVCWSEGNTGAVEKSGGSFLMECCVFELCRGNGKNTNSAGQAFTSIDSAVKWRSILALNCWTSKSPYTDNVFCILRGSATESLVNSSHCTSTGGTICGVFNNVEKGAKLFYLQGESGDNNNFVEDWSTDQTILYLNAINNTLSSSVFWQKSCTLTLENCCVFGNSRSNMYGSPILINCISDTAIGATIQSQKTQVNFKVIHNCQSSFFTKKESNSDPFIFFCHLIL